MRKWSVKNPFIYHTDFNTTRIAFRKFKSSVVTELLSDEQNHFTVTKSSNKTQWTTYMYLRGQPKFWPRISQLLGHCTETARFTTTGFEPGSKEQGTPVTLSSTSASINFLPIAHTIELILFTVMVGIVQMGIWKLILQRCNRLPFSNF